MLFPLILFIAIASAKPMQLFSNGTVTASLTVSEALPSSAGLSTDIRGSLEVASNPYDTTLYPYNIVPANATLASFCSSAFEAETSLWLATASVTESTWAITFLNAAKSTTEDSMTYSSYDEPFTYTPAPPCCLNCTLYGGHVQVFYWPTITTSNSVSTLVNQAGFTFISPSVYVAFQSLHAVNLCGTVGPSINATTLAFPPNELSTATAFFYNTTQYPTVTLPYISDPFEIASWGDRSNCTDITTTYTGPMAAKSSGNWLSVEPESSSIEYSSSSPAFVLTYNLCSPSISVPKQIFTINPLWAGCVQGIDALYDPPYILTSTNGLTPVFPTGHPPVVESASATIYTSSGGAVVGATPTPPTASSTPTSTGIPTSVKDPPGQSPSTAASDPPPNTAGNDHPNSSNQDPPPKNSQSSSPLPSIPNEPTPTTIPSITQVSTYLIGSSQTLIPGSPGLTIFGTTYSLQIGGGSVVIDGSTHPASYLTFFSQNPLQTTSQMLIYIPGGTRTLIAGSPGITISGTTFSLQAGGSSVIIDGTTYPTSDLLASSAMDFVIGLGTERETLIPGGAPVTISENGGVVTVSLENGAGGESVVIDGTRTTVGVSTAGTAGIAEIIASLGGFNGGQGLSVSSTVVGGGGGYNGTVFASGAEMVRGEDWNWTVVMGLAAFLACIS